VGRGVHRLHLLLDELVEAAFVLQADAVEAATAHDFLLEPFEEVGSFFPPNEDVDFVDAAQRVQKFLKKHFSEETCRPRNQNPFTLISFFYWHIYFHKL
jgi:hypothetical protein